LGIAYHTGITKTSVQQRRTGRAVANNYILIVFDSCRYDSFTEARPRVMKKLGRVERRWSYASWTSPSHFNLLMGLLPQSSPKHVFASEFYTRDFLKYNDRLGLKDVQFQSLAPQLLPPFLKESLGYSVLLQLQDAEESGVPSVSSRERARSPWCNPRKLGDADWGSNGDNSPVGGGLEFLNCADGIL
jgi:hypothetical protein